MKNLTAKLLCLCLALCLIGCNSNRNSVNISPAELARQNELLRQKISQQQIRIDKLNQQLRTLRGFPAEQLENLVQVADIAFGRYTRAIDNNGDNCDDGLRIYLVLYDRDGHRIKAAGKATIELWDLAASDKGSLLGRWQFSLPELSQHFLSGVLTNHFKFTLGWPEEKMPANTNLTLKLSYLDALTGSSFETQKLLTANICPAN